MKELIKKYSELSKAKEIGSLQRLARKRQLKDLKNPPEGYKFSIEKAQRVVDFLQLLPHVKGQLAGTLFKLEEWQKYDIIYPLFGWVTDDENEYRRFKMGYNEMARKTGKSFLMSGLAIYMTWLDGEPGAETYVIATKRDQARLVFDVAHEMINRTALGRRIKVAYTTLTYNGCKFQPLGADSKTLDGTSSSFNVVDEYHAHVNSHLLDVMKSSTGSRVNALTLIITTAGFNKSSPCFAEREYSEKVLKGQIENERYFVFIAALDKKDNPFDESVWVKANPNLGVSNSIEDMRNAAKEAKDKGGQTLTEFLTKRLNRWMEASSVWVGDEAFLLPEEYNFNEDEMQNRDCYIGMDLSKTSDLSSYSLIFPMPNGEYRVICRTYVPEDSVKDRERGDNIYKKFIDQGTLKVTPGNVIDYYKIEADIKADMEKFNVVSLAYDRYMSYQIVTNLVDEGLDCVPFGQGYASMSSPTQFLETLLLTKKLHHNNDALLRWQLSNVQIERDPGGNIKMSKATSNAGTGNRIGSAAKIDSWIATVMGLALASKNIYEEESEDSGLYLI